MIDFSVEPEFQAKLDWMNKFVREECETMDLLFPEMGLAFADGPTDVHRSQLARAFMKNATPAPGMFPTEHVPTRTQAALARYPKARG